MLDHWSGSGSPQRNAAFIYISHSNPRIRLANPTHLTLVSCPRFYDTARGPVFFPPPKYRSYKKLAAIVNLLPYLHIHWRLVNNNLSLFTVHGKTRQNQAGARGDTAQITDFSQTWHKCWVWHGVQMIMQKNLGQNILFPSRYVKLKIIQCELARGRKFSGEQ